MNLFAEEIFSNFQNEARRKGCKMAISEGSLCNLKDFFAQICLCEASQDNVRKIEIYFQIEIFGQV